MERGGRGGGLSSGRAVDRHSLVSTVFKPSHAHPPPYVPDAPPPPPQVAAMKERNYLQANDIYLKLAIGNSPWPIGVTQV